MDFAKIIMDSAKVIMDSAKVIMDSAQVIMDSAKVRCILFGIYSNKNTASLLINSPPFASTDKIPEYSERLHQGRTLRIETPLMNSYTIPFSPGLSIIAFLNGLGNRVVVGIQFQSDGCD